VDSTWFVIVVIVLVIVVAVIALDYFGRKERVKKMRELASRLGYEFVEKEEGLADALGGLPVLSRGHIHRASNLLRTTVDDAAVAVFDHEYETGHGKKRQVHKQSILLLDVERLNLPAFSLRPEGISQKLAGALGGQDIDFENHPKFSAAYVLQGADEAQIRARFGSDILDYFARHPGLCVEVDGRKLVCYRAGKRIAPEKVESFLGEGIATMRALAGEPVA